jgi:hypothetical protein
MSQISWRTAGRTTLSHVNRRRTLGKRLQQQFPAAYQKSPKGSCTLHWGPQHQARLLIPTPP